MRTRLRILASGVPAIVALTLTAGCWLLHRPRLTVFWAIWVTVNLAGGVLATWAEREEREAWLYITAWNLFVPLVAGYFALRLTSILPGVTMVIAVGCAPLTPVTWLVLRTILGLTKREP